MEKRQKILIIFTLSIVLVLIASASLLFYNSSKTVVRLGGQKVVVRLAQTSQEMAQGLSNTRELESGTGMLFVYTYYSQPQFWMKEMNYPIDIIWIKDDVVVGFVQNAPIPIAGQELPRYQPQEAINYVLEVPAGFVDKYALGVGSSVAIERGINLTN